MTKRWRLCLMLLLLLVVGLLLVPQVRWPAYGWLRGEASYQGMPTTWWAKEIEESYHYIPFVESEHGVTSEWCVDSSASLWDQWLLRLKPGPTAIPVRDIILGSPLLMGDPEALPVLLALIRGDSVKGRRVAIRGLLAHGKSNPEVVQALLAAIDDSDNEVRQDAIAALGDLGPDAAAKPGVK